MAENTEKPRDWNEKIAYLRDLAAIVRDEGLSEVEIESDGVQISLKGVQTTVVAAPVAATAPPGAAAHSPAPALTGVPTAPQSSEKLTPIVSPMVGVFYRAPSPNDPNFVEIGDRVEIGQTIAIVEAMKVFNEIVAEAAGFVAEIPAENAALVETGAPLILLRA